VAYAVVAERTDEPGSIARLGAAIIEAGINIEDLDVLRNDASPTMRLRLVFESEDGVVAILDSLGWRFAPDRA
jgi:acetolactate synthase small subunit